LLIRLNPALAWKTAIVALCLPAVAAAEAGQKQPPVEMRSVRAWSGSGTTRIVVELSRETKWKYGRLAKPERLFVDFAETRPQLGPKRIHVIAVGDSLVERARVAMKDPATTRLVLDLTGDVEFELSHLTNPERLVIELKAKASGARLADASPAAPATPPSDMAANSGARKPSESPTRSAELRSSAPAAAANSEAVAKRPTAAEPRPAAPAAEAQRTSAAPPKETVRTADKSVMEAGRSPEAGPIEKRQAREETTATKAPETARTAEKTAAAEAPSPEPDAPTPQPARPTRAGTRSLTRALGLHIGRVVLDPGHGGHDQGTKGPKGLLEKDLVLDVALRLGSLIEQRLGAEVVYTRQTDVFVPLEERTAIANEQKADLFLSIHANSSPVKSVSGAEVFYLNFTTSKEALDLAARENAGHGKSIFELRELIQKIALKDKLDESREFAGFVQRELSREWKRLNSAARDRGVKQAPFVVLIGASMPSVLAEVGFLSNPRDEELLKKPEYRDRLAEALYRGVERYAQSLGQTQALRAATPAVVTQSTR
jgi:N-acetylmuramoyl-L-alanine amidase